MRAPHRRTVTKVIHWAMVPMFAWFVLVQPADVARVGPAAVRFHSVMGLIFVSTALLWTGLYLRRGLLSRPGPKLQGWARWLYPVLHKTLIWGICGVALTGLLIGITSSVQLWAGGIVPIAVPLDLPQANDWIGAGFSDAMRRVLNDTERCLASEKRSSGKSRGWSWWSVCVYGDCRGAGALTLICLSL